MFALNDSKVRKVQAAIMLLICMMAAIVLILDLTTPIQGNKKNYFEEYEILQKVYTYYENLGTENSEESAMGMEGIKNAIALLNKVFYTYLVVSIVVIITAVVMWKFKLPQLFFLPLFYYLVCKITFGPTYDTVIAFAAIMTILLAAYDVLWFVQWRKKRKEKQQAVTERNNK